MSTRPFNFIAHRSGSSSIPVLAMVTALVLTPLASVQAVPRTGDLSIATSQSALPGSFADLVERVRPAVVNISTTAPSRGARPDMPRFAVPDDGPMRDFFERYFNDPSGTSRERPAPEMHALGSGFIVDAAGHVVTNAHVVAGATEVTVTMDDGRTFPATVRGIDSKTDLALLKIKAEQALPYLNFGDSKRTRPGDWVIAIGNPFGLGGSVSTGIVSASGRDINAGPFDDFIQVDAAINRGNSGGPLFNTTGEVIGINTAIFSPSGGSIGIGFAIPADLAGRVIDELKANGEVERGWLGVQVQSLTEDMAESLGLESDHGALVAGVMNASPASRAGLQPGDVITSFDGSPVETVRDLPRLVADQAVGSRTSLKIFRHGKTKELHATLEKLKDEEQLADSSSVGDDPLGLSLADLTPELRERLDAPEDFEGVVVLDVAPDGPAARTGIREGDRILMVGQKRVSETGDVTREVKRAVDAKRKTLLILVERDEDTRFVTIKLNSA